MSLVRDVSKAFFAIADRFLPTPPGPRILIYHQVGAGLGRQMEVTAQDFGWQLDWLTENREVVDLETVVRRWQEPESERLVVLTFDDGYEDVYTIAYPLLLEMGHPFTLYLSTRMLEAGTDERGVRALRWESITEMLRSGLVTIGGHTHTHPDLRALTAATIEEQLTTCDALIEERLGVRPQHFAYPYGYWSETAARLVDDRYRSAALGARLPGPPRAFDPWKLFRVPVQHSDGARWFKSRLEGGLASEEWVRRRVRGYKGP